MAVAVVGASSITVGLLVLDWLVLTTPPGGQTTRTFWWIVTNARTGEVAGLDKLLFSSPASGPWLHLLGAAAVVWLLVRSPLFQHRMLRLGVAAAATVGALAAGYLAWRIQDSSRDGQVLIERFGASADLGPGPYLTIAGFVIGAAGALWSTARR